MEISLLKALLSNISSFLHLSSYDNINVEPVHKYFQKVEEIMKLLKPVLDAIVDSRFAWDEFLIKASEELGQSVDELRELFENFQLLSSKVYFVLQTELIMSKAKDSGLDIFQLLKSSHQQLPTELSLGSIEQSIQKIKHIGYEQLSSVIKEAMRDQMEGVGPSSEILAKIAESLSLRSNQEVLIEAVALEKLKESFEQAEKAEEAEYIDQMIALVTHVHERLVMIKQSQGCSPVPIPTDFCCPLSLELMTDPVIVASGQTYERAFIRKWIDRGLTVCPKTRQTLAHTNLIPNYNVKALIANWCELNNVKLPDPMKSVNSDHPSTLLSRAEPGAPRNNNPPHLSPESSRSAGSPARNLAPSSGVYREGTGTSPLHARSTSEGSLSIAGNRPGMDIGRVSLTSSEEKSNNLDERKTDGQPSSAAGEEERFSQGHSRTASASSVISNSNSQGIPGDANEVSQTSSAHSTGYQSESSGEVRVNMQPAATMNTSQREPEFSSRMETRPRNQSMWRRPPERFIPRIVPSNETRPDRSGIETQVKKLVEDLQSPSVDTQRDATGEVRLLAKHSMDNRIVIANCGAVAVLVDLLRSTDAKIQENAVTALLNLSINDNNKSLIAGASAIEPLIHVLETGSPEAKENSAATLFSLSVIEDNKVRIGRSGAIRPLVDLLGDGTPRGKKDAATALFNLSIFHENKARIVQAGAVKYLVELMDPAAGMVDKAVAVLANLATITEGRSAIGQEGGIPVLVEVVELGSARGKENAAAALLQLCTTSGRHCTMVLQEGAVPPLVALSQSGTPRAKEKAQALLSYFRNQRHGNSGRG